MSDVNVGVDEELEEQRAFVVRSLDDLERERAAGDLDDEDYTRLKDDYEARLADLDRAIEAGPVDDAAASVSQVKRRGAVWKLVTGVLLLALVAGFAGWGVARSSGDRVAGDQATGSIIETKDQKLNRALQLYTNGKPVDALKAIDAILRDDPAYVPAVTYRGWLLRLAGSSAGNTDLIDQGMQWLDKAITLDPTYPDAHFFKGFSLLQDRNDPAAAAKELQAALDNHPPEEMTPSIQGMLAQAEAAAAGKLPPGVTPATTTTAPG